MEIEDVLERAEELIGEEKYAEALSLLDRWNRKNPPDSDTLLLRVEALQGLGRHREAMQTMDQVIALEPDDPGLWIHRAGLHPEDEGGTQRLEDIDRGLSRFPDDQGLLYARIWHLYEYQGEAAATEYLEAILHRYPALVELCLIPVDWHLAKIYDIEGVETVKDRMGMEYAVSPLEAALRACNKALAHVGPHDWRLPYKRASILMKLQRFDQATEDFDVALSNMPESEPARELVQEQRDDCLDGGLGASRRLAKTLTDSMDSGKQGEGGDLGDHVAQNLVRAMATRLEKGATLEDTLSDLVSDDPEDMMALSIAENIYSLANEPSPELTPADTAVLSRPTRRYLERAGAQLLDAGFEPLGDYVPEHLSPIVGQRVPMRLFRDAEGEISAAVYQVKPLWPGVLTWLTLLVSGKWKAVKVVELESCFTDDQVLVTNNSGDAGPFGYGASIDIQSLPTKTPISELYALHRQRLEAYRQDHTAESLLEVRDLEGLCALQEQVRRSKNAYRKSIDYVQDHELQRLLGKQFDKLAPLVRSKLAILASES